MPGTDYYGDGCEYSEHCLECSRPRCKYDDEEQNPVNILDGRKARKYAEIASLREQERLTITQLAVRCGVSMSTVFRVLRMV